MTDAASSTTALPLRSLAIGQLLALVGDVSLIAAVTVVVAQLESRTEIRQNLALAAMGGALAVVSVTAAWLSLGPLARSVRLVAAPLACLAALFLAAIVWVLIGDGSDRVVVIVLAIFLAGIWQFLLLQAPYWLLASWHRLRIVHRREIAVGGAIECLQYSLGQMLLVMSLIALALGIGRGIITLATVARGQEDRGMMLVAFFAMLVGYNLLVMWPLLWGVLSPTANLWKVASAILLAALAVISAYFLTTTVLAGGEGVWVFWLVFVPQPAFLLTHLFATRVSGYRLVKMNT